VLCQFFFNFGKPCLVTTPCTCAVTLIEDDGLF